MSTNRLVCAMVGIVACWMWYYANQVTQLFEVNASFWPRFIMVESRVRGSLCTSRGSVRQHT